MWGVYRTIHRLPAFHQQGFCGAGDEFGSQGSSQHSRGRSKPKVAHTRENAFHH